MLDSIRRFFSKENEPVRRKLYGFVGPVLTLLVAKGYLTDNDADYISGLVGYLLLVPVTEWIRSAVTPFAIKPKTPRAAAPKPTGRHAAADS